MYTRNIWPCTRDFVLILTKRATVLLFCDCSDHFQQFFRYDHFQWRQNEQWKNHKYNARTQCRQQKRFMFGFQVKFITFLSMFSTRYWSNDVQNPDSSILLPISSVFLTFLVQGSFPIGTNSIWMTRICAEKEFLWLKINLYFRLIDRYLEQGKHSHQHKQHQYLQFILSFDDLFSQFSSYFHINWCELLFINHMKIISIN